MPHRVLVERVVGVSATGDDLSAPTLRRAQVQEKQHLVVDGSGKEVVSSARVWLDLLPHVAPGSYVTYWLGTERERRARVITTTVWDHPGTPAHLHLDLE